MDVDGSHISKDIYLMHSLLKGLFSDFQKNKSQGRVKVHESQISMDFFSLSTCYPKLWISWKTAAIYLHIIFDEHFLYGDCLAIFDFSCFYRQFILGGFLILAVFIENSLQVYLCSGRNRTLPSTGADLWSLRSSDMRARARSN